MNKKLGFLRILVLTLRKYPLLRFNDYLAKYPNFLKWTTKKNNFLGFEYWPKKLRKDKVLAKESIGESRYGEQGYRRNHP